MMQVTLYALGDIFYIILMFEMVNIKRVEIKIWILISLD